MASAAPTTAERLEIIIEKLHETQRKLGNDTAIANMSEAQIIAAGGFGHDLANLITPTQFMLTLKTEDAELTKDTNYAIAIINWIEYQETLMTELDTIMTLTHDAPYNAFALKPKPVELNTQLQKLQKMLRALVITDAKSKESDLEFHSDFVTPPETPLNFDWLALQRAIINLTINALNATVRGRITLSIHVKAASESKAHLDISIRDTGRGIETGAFEKPEPTAKAASHGSAGWGTHYCRTIVKAMGGTLTHRGNDIETGGTIIELGNINADYARSPTAVTVAPSLKYQSPRTAAPLAVAAGAISTATTKTAAKPDLDPEKITNCCTVS